MKVTKELEYKVSVRATLDDEGNLRLGVSANAPYGNRTATATVNKFSKADMDAVKEVLEGIITRYAQKAVTLAEHGAAQARIVAANLGEEI